jgi:palmitoyltransferase
MLVLGGFAMFVLFGFPLLPNKRLGRIHVFLPFLLVLWTTFTFVLASVAPPGYVTQKNFHILEKVYPYDGFIFVKRECTTCGTPRVARSKHDRMLNRCVEKFDHFCPWINTCVGAQNFRYFLLFVLSTAVFLVYGTFVFWNLLSFIVERDKLWSVKFMNTGTNEVMQADWKIIAQFMLSSHGPLVFLFILCLVMGITLVGFFAYQIYLIKNGITSNEAQKWGEVKDFYSSSKWKRELDARGTDYTPDSELLGENTASLNDRMVKEFPSKIPPNLYNRGFWGNLKDVIWPESIKQKKLWVQSQKQQSSLQDNRQTGTTATPLVAAKPSTKAAGKTGKIGKSSKKKN